MKKKLRSHLDVNSESLLHKMHTIKIRCQLVFCGKLTSAPENNKIIAYGSSPYCVGMSRRYCCLTSFFPIVHTCLSCEDIAGQSCAVVSRWQISGIFSHPVFSTSHVQPISHLHSKYALRSHRLWKYGSHPMRDG